MVEQYVCRFQNILHEFKIVVLKFTLCKHLQDAFSSQNALKCGRCFVTIALEYATRKVQED